MQMWMILELEVRHPGDKEFMEKSFYLENLFWKDVKSVGGWEMGLNLMLEQAWENQAS